MMISSTVAPVALASAAETPEDIVKARPQFASTTAAYSLFFIVAPLQGILSRGSSIKAGWRNVNDKDSHSIQKRNKTGKRWAPGGAEESGGNRRSGVSWCGRRDSNSHIRDTRT